MSIRVGIGFDLHRLIPGDSVVLGGVIIPYTKCLSGHSDGDVLVHAITDALLGASGVGDIGVLFPDTDIRFKGMSSLRFLEKAAEVVRGKGFEIGNVDANVLAEKPKLSPYFERMECSIASALGVQPDQVHVKAKTMEKIGPIGREEAMAAEAVALILAVPHG